MRARWLFVPFGVLLCPLRAGGETPGGRPVVAVFSVEDRTGKLSESLLAQLTDYLTAKVAEGGYFQIVPRAQIKARLTEQKKESYKACYDEKCQIEIGRELAAQKSLSTQVIQIGTRCAVTATLFDLRRAASEGSASEKSGCTEDELVAAVERVATLLKPRMVEAGRRAVATGQLILRSVPGGAQVFVDGMLRGQGPFLEPLPLSPGRHLIRVEQSGHEAWEQSLNIVLRSTATAAVSLLKRVSVEIDTEPSGASLILDQTPKGRTPVRVELAPRRSYALRLSKPGFQQVEKTLEPGTEEDQQLTYPLEPTPEHSGSRTEFLSLWANLAVGMGDGGFVAGGGAVDFVTIKWKYIAWTIFTMGGGAGPDRGYIHGESRLAYPLIFGRRGQHQLRISAGFGVASYGEDKTAYVLRTDQMDPPMLSLCVTPGAEYAFASRGRLLLGAAFRVLVPAGRDLLLGRSGLPIGLLGLRVGFGAAQW